MLGDALLSVNALTITHRCDKCSRILYGQIALAKGVDGADYRVEITHHEDGHRLVAYQRSPRRKPR